MARNHFSRVAAGVIGLSSVLALKGASAQKAPPDMAITPEIRKEVIEGALKQLNENYVYPELAKKMEAGIRKHIEAKDYDQITSARKFAETLTTHLRDVSHDKHIRILYRAETSRASVNQEPTDADKERVRRQMAAVNFGFEKVERLEGNIGYLDLRGFMSPEFSGETVAAAMNFLANTDAVIIDLRKNGGGDPTSCALISTYLFGPEPVHLNDIYNRPDNSTRQSWTLPYVPGKRLAGKDIYLLTSNYTFSCAEEFCYNLKNLKRATIIGEVTGGGAHPGGPMAINDHFAVWTPMGRAINPISKDDWEGKGVQPDVVISADQAMNTAHFTAVKKLIAASSDSRNKEMLQSVLERLEKEKPPVKAAN
jgi:C-terminal processing protease CtpA/Prc